MVHVLGNGGRFLERLRWGVVNFLEADILDAIQEFLLVISLWSDLRKVGEENGERKEEEKRKRRQKEWMT